MKLMPVIGTEFDSRITVWAEVLRVAVMGIND